MVRSLSLISIPPQNVPGRGYYFSLCAVVPMSHTNTGWRFRLVKRVGLDQRSYSTPGPVSAWMDDRLWVGKPFWYVTHVNSARLSLRG